VSWFSSFFWCSPSDSEPDHRIRSPLLYPAELQAQTVVIISKLGFQIVST